MLAEPITSTVYMPLIMNNYCIPAKREGLYLFLDDADVQRIRYAVATNPETQLAWSHVQQDVNGYLNNFPTTYDPDDGWNVTWAGGGHYWPRDIALAYLVTGEDRYADGTRRILNLVISNTDVGGMYGDELFIQPKHGPVTYQALLFAYMALRNTTWLTNQQRAQYDDFFIREAAALLAYTQFPPEPLTPQNAWNWWISADTAIATMSVAFRGNAAADNLYQPAVDRLARRLTGWWLWRICGQLLSNDDGRAGHFC